MNELERKITMKTRAANKRQGRFWNDNRVAKYGDPVERGNQIAMIENENGDRVPMQRGMYRGIVRDSDRARFRIEFPEAVKLQMGDLFTDNADEGVREAKRYVGELLGIGCAPKAVPV